MMKLIENDSSIRNAIQVVCNNCGKKFLKATRHIKRKPGSKHYCSRACASEGLKNRAVLKCSNCGKKFERAFSKMKCSKSGFYFCSRKCKNSAQCIGGISEIQPPHYGKSIRMYRSIAFRKYDTKCETCEYDDHPEILEVHHIDKDRENNKLLNLIILCPNCHAALTCKHAKLKYRKLIWKK